MENWVLPFNNKLISKAQEFGVNVICGGGFLSGRPSGKFDVNLLIKSFDLQAVSRRLAPSISIFPNLHSGLPFSRLLRNTWQSPGRMEVTTSSASIDARIVRDGPMDKIVAIIKRIIDIFGRDYELSIALANVPVEPCAACSCSSSCCTYLWTKTHSHVISIWSNFVFPSKEFHSMTGRGCRSKLILDEDKLIYRYSLNLKKKLKRGENNDEILWLIFLVLEISREIATQIQKSVSSDIFEIIR